MQQSPGYVNLPIGCHCIAHSSLTRSGGGGGGLGGYFFSPPQRRETERDGGMLQSRKTKIEVSADGVNSGKGSRNVHFSTLHAS
jgi:hypothetical protein